MVFDYCIIQLMGNISSKSMEQPAGWQAAVFYSILDNFRYSRGEMPSYLRNMRLK